MIPQTPFSVPSAVSDESEPFSSAFSQPEPAEEAPFSVAPQLGTPTNTRHSQRLKRFVAAMSSSVVLVACGLLGYSLWETRISGWVAEREQANLRVEFKQVAVTSSTATNPPRVRQGASLPRAGTTPQERVIPVLPATGKLVGQLQITAIDLDWMVVAGTDSATLKKGPGAWLSGAFPGAPGNATLAAHRTTYGGPFRRLGDLQQGDTIIFTSPTGSRSEFVIRGMGVVSPKDVYVTRDVPGVRLTLLTCDPPGTAARRLVIQAELVKGEFQDRALPADSWTFLDK